MKKFIFITGGVVSSLGKGLTAASIGRLLESRGLQVTLQKFDPYINVDPGTMSPYQHGEVFVTDDGAETDLDLGHYERFTSSKLTQNNNVTTGQIYESVIKNERAGKYLGKTVQVIPHITNEIKNRIKILARDKNTDIVITEIGGTVGDIESLPFLEAIRQFRLDVGVHNTLYIHLTLVPYIRAAGEMKTKPTQHSVEKLRSIGIQPDILICRTEKPLKKELKDKISLFCNIPREAVIEERDVAVTVYELPLMFQREKVDQIILDRLVMEAPQESDLTSWSKIIDSIKNSKDKVTIAVVGKYINLQDSYKSIYEAIDHAGIHHCVKVDTLRIDAEGITSETVGELLAGVDGILVPGGFGDRGIDGKIKAIQYARENKIPYFGICLGMQCAVIEFARNVIGLSGAHSTELDPECVDPVVCLMEEQKQVSNLGGTMRLGAYECALSEGSKAIQAYGGNQIFERHRHRYEFNNSYRKQFVDNGCLISGINHKNDLVEIVELADHPWFVACQFHPEFKSKPDRAHPLFRDFIGAALTYSKIVDEEVISCGR
ncbi:MAG: CTP synthase [Candidatus Auribacterota bacterium]|jgi:CTP synthase|nr:CTP synthase [Candidatus Auribacterota bacterium]